MNLLGVTDGEGSTPLDTALTWIHSFDGCGDVALYLINRGCGTGNHLARLLCGACSLGRLDVVKELVEQHKVDPNSEWSF